MRVLFLDVDGVLNNTRSMVLASQGGLHPAGPLGKMFTVDRHCVRRLRAVVEELDLRIVVSSTWRRHPRALDTALLWADNWRAPIIGKTATSYDKRGEQIAAWCRENRLGPQDFVIVDDDTYDIDQPGQAERLVHCAYRRHCARRKKRLTRRERRQDWLDPKELRRQVGFTEQHTNQIRALFSAKGP